MAIPLIVPLINPNEPEALLAALDVENGQQIGLDDFICTLETTKSTYEVFAEQAGFVVGLQFEAGQTVRAGEILLYIADSPDWQPEAVEPESQGVVKSTPADLRITKPALALAESHQLDLTILPRDRLITAADVRTLLEAESAPIAAAQPEFDPTALVIYGAGGHGKALADLLGVLKTYQIVGFVDDGRLQADQIMGLPFLGGSEVLPDLYRQGVRLAANAVGGIGNVAVRLKVFEKLAQAGFVCPAVVHPTAWVEPSAHLSPGVQVFAHAYVGSEAVVGFGAIVNTGAIVSHDCRLGEVVNLSPGAILAGEVIVGAGALIGMGVTVNLQVEIGDFAKVGNGATVKQNIPKNGIVGAGRVWPG